MAELKGKSSKFNAKNVAYQRNRRKMIARALGRVYKPRPKASQAIRRNQAKVQSAQARMSRSKTLHALWRQNPAWKNAVIAARKSGKPMAINKSIVVMHRLMLRQNRVKGGGSLSTSAGGRSAAHANKANEAHFQHDPRDQAKHLRRAKSSGKAARALKARAAA